MASEGGAVKSTAIIAALLAVLYGLALRKVGYVTASVVCLAVTFLWLGATSWWKSLVLAIAAAVVTFAVFRHVFLVLLP